MYFLVIFIDFAFGAMWVLYKRDTFDSLRKLFITWSVDI